ncbi:MAG: BON domain-containing protein [Dysgonamonadaceae bacterium]|jgi:osmotically-inducible protein OsmY|nr:BON domain-containing protein [Dysgonamonadaceae bacterium]MDD4246313.1 BON domain-containing protein [Dysgonamonadaceae bacterium]
MKKVKLLSMFSLFLLLTASFVACNSVKDSDLESKAIELIATNPDASEVDVTVTDKVATLSGTVEDEVTKSYVESSVQGVKGIESVINNIMVIPPAPDYTEINAALNAALPDALKDHPTVMAEVKDGIIILTGDVKEKDLPMIMEKVSALNPLGVENNLNVK